ncbi:MAG: sensory rhodopsin transducer [Christensenella sp.]
MNYGKKVWIFPDTELPPEGVNVIPGHESVIVTNVSDEVAKIRITRIFEDQDPDCFDVEVQPMRVRCMRTSAEKDFGSHTAVVGQQYAIMLESNVNIVVQYGRAETREVAFYTTPGYCE